MIYGIIIILITISLLICSAIIIADSDVAIELYILIDFLVKGYMERN